MPPPGFTFPCSAGVVERLGRPATCRYQISQLGAKHKAEITWRVAEERCRDMELFGAGARLAEPRTPDQVQFLASTPTNPNSNPNPNPNPNPNSNLILTPTPTLTLTLTLTRCSTSRASCARTARRACGLGCAG